MPGEDLAGLFRPPDPVEPFRQGVVLAFDTATGTSSVDVGGVVLANLPLLNIGDTVNLKAGDVVVLMRINGSWAILGRVVTPNSGVLNSSAIGLGGSNPNSGGGFSVSTSAVAKASGTIAVPAWANRASVICTVAATVRNTTAGSSFTYVSAAIAGVGGSESFATAPAGEYLQLAAHATRNNEPVTPGGTISVEGRVRAGVAYANDASNFLQVDSFAVFTKA